MKSLIKYFVYISLIIALSFALPRLIPGSPLFAMVEDVSSVGNMTKDALKAFEKYYSPELPLLEQFAKYLNNIFKLDFGYSFYYKMSVLQLIKGRVGWTLLLSFLSIGISSLIGIFLGIRSGLKGRESKLLVSSFISIHATPTFLIAAIFQIIIAYKLRLLPATGAYTTGASFGQPGYILDVINHMILPLLVLVISQIPPIYLFAKNSTANVKKEQFVKMATYLKINKKDMYLKYIFKNIIPELLGRLNIQFVLAITGSIFVEAVFSYPGLGQLLRSAISYRDYPLLQAILLVCCTYGIVVNFIFELIALKNVKRC
ncbi:MAG: ABC transporter permease [Tissierellales bacterium]